MNSRRIQARAADIIIPEGSSGVGSVPGDDVECSGRETHLQGQGERAEGDGRGEGGFLRA